MKKILRSLLFLGLLGLLLIPLSLVLRPKDNTEDAGIYRSSAAEILSQTPDSIQVLFLGDSEAYSSFVPLDLWTRTGVTGFVSSSLDQKTYETLELLNMALSCQSPKVVVLETNVLYRVYATTDALSPQLEAKIPALRYHDRWKHLGAADFFTTPHYTAESPDRGYYLLQTAEPADVSNYMTPMDEWEPLSRANRNNLRKIADICQKRDIQLLLFSSPSPTNWTMRRHNTIQDTADSLGLPYIDGNLLDLNIDWDTDTYDGGDHLNYSGAAKVTAWLADYLTTHYPTLTDCRQDPAYQNWTRDAEAFRARVS